MTHHNPTAHLNGRQPSCFVLFLMIMLSPFSVRAQVDTIHGSTDLLKSIEYNNPQLRAARSANSALMADQRAENRPGSTTIEYSPFYTSGYEGVASSELIVQQEFSFPTLYAARSRSATAMQQMLDAQYATLCRDVLLTAVCHLYDLCDANQRLALLSQRQASADSLLTAYERRLAEGDATLIDVNRIRLDQMTARAEALQASVLRDEIILQLVRLNDGCPLLSDITDCIDPSRFTASTVLAADTLPSMLTAFSNSHEVRQADAALQLSKREVSVARQSWLPQLSVGYRRNTERNEALNGFIVGVSLPLFGNKHKVKAARLRSEAASSELDAAMAAFDAQQESLRIRCRQLSRMLEAYDEALMHQQLMLLRHAVTAGELSVIDYYNEADRIYSLLEQRLMTLCDYRKTLAELYRDSLLAR